MINFVSVVEQGDSLKFEWSGPRYILTPYCVNAELVRKAGDQVRDELREIATKYKAIGIQYDAKDLKALASAGQRLFAALFLVTSGDASSAEYLKEKIEAQTTRSELSVFTDGNVTIPWNFIFRRDPDAIISAKFDLTDFDGFWTSIFKTSIRFNKMHPPSETAVPKSNMKTLLALHKDRFLDARHLLKSDNALLAKLDALLQHEIGEATNWNDCRAKWKTIADSDSVIYIFGHSDGTRLYLCDPPMSGKPVSDEYAIDTLGLLTSFPKKKGNKSNTIYFINGCRTAASNLGDGFLSVTSGPGFHGFIGCEAEITNEFATKYAAEFLDLLCVSGLSISDCIECLRTKLFPLSLWYSCYADPDFRIA
ncbi:hypothetical protein ACVWXQ_004248 [Bradyrhizobium sp. S3.14.4]